MAFKVLIAGGSVAGLTLALVLQSVNIEFEVLEKGDFATQLGATIGIQLGVWDEIEPKAIPLRHRRFYDADMKLWDQDGVTGKISDFEGHQIIFVERCEFLRTLHSHIRDKSRLHACTELSSYVESESGVTVKTSEGKTFEGSILVGADGVHSKTRNLVAEKLQSENKKLCKALQECYTSEFKCLFALTRVGPTLPLLPKGDTVFVYRKDHNTVAGALMPGLVFWAFFVKTPLTRIPNCPRFTDEDMDALIEEYGDEEIVPGATIRDFYKARVRASLVSLEEGIVQKWSHGRVVLVGDAVHKVTINAGLGGNLAIEGVTRLMNQLVPLIQNNEDLSSGQLQGAFTQYEMAHKPRAKTTLAMSAATSRVESEQNWLYNFASRWVQPVLSESMKMRPATLYSLGGTYLNFLPLSSRTLSKLEEKRIDQNQSWVRSVL
ncbi:Monooxygenase FAD-binding protein [Botryosphaeria dothidea]|uniref:Monooxygenase FAD-binding protein n=1 Tax=Botryosphaeria dothidea TaxID=55169 RepID=A0A8H4IL44_9PEZI|nr:Monooxygenase FAD-binding protein [Botryosphaeria dothidea]KAF4305099.1 Monooxygenase FAD-binding protein [Botryosphaeria dothidea]